MKQNIGKVDKIIRVVVGIIIMVLGLIFQSWLGILGIIPIATALLGFCGLYPLLGINTCKK